MELDLGPHRPLYGISVAAELTGVNAPMLRAYESEGADRALPHRRRHPALQRGRPGRRSTGSPRCWRPGSTWPACRRCYGSRTRRGSCGPR